MADPVGAAGRMAGAGEVTGRLAPTSSHMLSVWGKKSILSTVLISNRAFSCN